MPLPEGKGAFSPTHWSVVLAAGGLKASPEADRALETLCATYWYPLYAYARRQGLGPEDAQDATQGFFARLLEHEYLAHASPERGRFRSFLLAGFQRHLVSEWRRTQAARRRPDSGRVASLDYTAAEDRYTHEPPDVRTPELLYEQRWAAALMDRALAALRADYTQDGRGELFETLKDLVWGRGGGLSYTAIAEQLGLSEGAVKVAVHRMRTRFREFVRAEVAATVGDESDIDGELRHLARILT